MAVYRRGRTWWYKFKFNGEHVRESTKQSNKRVAEQMEAARKTGLAKGEVGIEKRGPKPTLKEFASQFTEAVETRSAAKPRTVAFYREKLKRLLEFDALASARLNEIDEALIERFVQRQRKRVSPATVNRQLATLRKLLRMSQEWKVIDRVPRIRLLPGERNRSFVLNFEQERLYLEFAPEPLHDIAVLLLDTGMRVGEALCLRWTDVHLDPAPKAKYGYIRIWEGKSKYAKRNLSLTGRVAAMFDHRSERGRDGYVFAEGKEKPILGTSLNHQHQKVRKLLKLPKDFVIHSFRHTMLTRLGESGADAFTIMRIAGHSSITVSQKYVHPTPESLERAFQRLEAMQLEKGGTKVGTVVEVGKIEEENNLFV